MQFEVSLVKYKEEFEKDLKERKHWYNPQDSASFKQAQAASVWASEAKYKEEFEKDLKERKHRYNPQDSASFKQAQAASVWASEVQYKTDLQELHDPSSDLPNSLYLGHALQASKLQSMFEYKKQYEKSKGHYHLALDTAERLHHKENAVLQSQVKYKEYYEKSKGKSMLEFVDTQAYQVSKGVQKIQSEKEYRKDLEEGIKGKGLTLLEDTPDLIRVKNAARILNEKEYRKDLENEIKGKGMELIADVPDIQRARKASHMASEVSYKQMSELRQNTYGTVTDTPEMLHAAHVKDIYSQVKYNSALKELEGKPCVIVDTPEMWHVRENQNNISMVRYHEDFEKTRGKGFTSVVDDPNFERVRRNTQVSSEAAYKGVHPHVVEMDRRPGIIVEKASHCSRQLSQTLSPVGMIYNVKYKDQAGTATTVKYNSALKELEGKPCVIVHTPEMWRVRDNQNNISVVVRYHEDFEKTRGKGFTSVVDDPNFERVRRNTQVSSEAAYKGVHPHVVEMDRRPGIIVAPVLPGAYHQGGQSPGFGYMHQTSIASMKSMQSPPHSATIRTYRAMYDYAAQDHDEVSFRDGDIIMNVQSIDQGWMYGTVQRTGLHVNVLILIKDLHMFG
ncbi:UNVERIFIED_CONTAM: hypothetical protein FKN15_057437 [Acipenser sinensis]